MIIGILSSFCFQQIYLLHCSALPCAFTAAYLPLMYVFHLDWIHVGKGLLFALLLFLAAYIDGKTHEIPNWLHPLLLLVGLIQLQPQDAIIGFFLISVPFLLLAIFTHGGFGAGDIKLIASCGFVLGALGVLLGTIIAMVLMIFVSLVFYRRSNRRKYCAMAPYIAVGCFFAYLIT